jgi:hypothetical protein
VAGLAACTPAVRSCTGIVVAVDGTGPANVSSVTVRQSDGVVLEFAVGRLDLNNGLPAAHLREHLASGGPIVVEYVVENGVNVALRYNDAPAPSG